MDLSRLGVLCFLDPLPGAALGPFARKVERLGYSTLWFAWGPVETLRARIAAHVAAGATHVCVLPLRVDGSRAPDEHVLEALAPAA
jgi:hypothetical protein